MSLYHTGTPVSLWDQIVQSAVLMEEKENPCSKELKLQYEGQQTKTDRRRWTKECWDTFDQQLSLVYVCQLLMGIFFLSMKAGMKVSLPGKGSKEQSSARTMQEIVQ